MAARVGLLLLHQRRRAAVVRRRRLGALRAQARGARLLSQPVHAAEPTARSPTRLTAPTFRQLIESRDAQFGALAGVAFAEGIVVREPVARPGLLKHAAMNIGIVCYASVGGSGVVATELAHALAARGHDVHLISSEPPFRLALRRAGPVVRTGRDADVPAVPRAAVSAGAHQHDRARRATSEQLDIVHAHYAVPHATAAYLADQILTSAPGVAARRATVTTLHGTDITLVGSDPSYARVGRVLDRAVATA